VQSHGTRSRPSCDRAAAQPGSLSHCSSAPILQHCLHCTVTSTRDLSLKTYFGDLCLRSVGDSSSSDLSSGRLSRSGGTTRCTVHMGESSCYLVFEQAQGHRQEEGFKNQYRHRNPNILHRLPIFRLSSLRQRFRSTQLGIRGHACPSRTRVLSTLCRTDTTSVNKSGRFLLSHPSTR
jgi:hypothetical protein